MVYGLPGDVAAGGGGRAECRLGGQAGRGVAVDKARVTDGQSRQCARRKPWSCYAAVIVSAAGEIVKVPDT